MTPVLILVNTFDEQLRMLMHKNFFGSFYNENFTGPQTCYKNGLLSNFEGVHPLECNICQKNFVQMETGDKNVAIDWKTSLF